MYAGVELRYAGLCLSDDRYRCISLRFGSFLVVIGTEVGIFIHRHGHGVRNIHDSESCISGRQAMFCGIQTCDLFFLRYTEPHCFLDQRERNIYGNDRPKGSNQDSSQLLSQLD